jgi:hypothetical protein
VLEVDKEMYFVYMKTLKITGGVLLGWICGSAPVSIISMSAGLTGTRSADLIQVSVAFCGAVLGGVITYKKVNLEKYRD